MNFDLPLIPERPSKPRTSGITMVIDKGLSVQEAINMSDVSGHLIDYVKLGFGTSAITNNLEEKIKAYQDRGITVYFGGTLFEAFIIRDKLDYFIELLAKYKLDTLEVSDGSMYIDHQKKCEYIADLSKNFTVISEVGAKEAGVVLTHSEWINRMRKELDAGSEHVIAEGRESGTVGIFGNDGNADNYLIQEILKEVPKDKIIWETPHKAQQAWFILKLGANVNLGNINTSEVIALETLRLGLRGDTFFRFLPEEYQSLRIPIE